MMTPQAREHDFVERIARAWASIDGRAEKFDACKADPELDKTQGHYMGYMEEARELLRRADIKAGDCLPGGFFVAKAVVEEHEQFDDPSLLNCPFCGSQESHPILWKRAFNSKKIPPWLVMCMDCLIDTPLQKSRQEAIAFWNRRSD